MAKKKNKGNNSQAKRNATKRGKKQTGKKNVREKEARKRHTAECERIRKKRDADRAAGRPSKSFGLGSHQAGELPAAELLAEVEELLKKKK